MPYVRRGLCVYKRDTDEKVGCSDTVEQAEAYLRKLRMETAGEGKTMKDTWITLDEMQKLCPDCAEQMRAKNFTRVNVKQMPEQMLRGLCQKYGGDPGFFTACQNNPPSEVDDPESFCAWLHEQCTGIWPGEHRSVDMRQGDADKMVMRPTQAEVIYVTLSAKKGQACANCRWFHSMGGMFGCHLIENYPEDILPTGRCERWEAKPEMTPQTVTIEAESVTINPAPEMPMATMALSDTTEVTAEKVGRVLNKKNEAALRSIMDTIKDVLVKAGIMQMEDDEEMPHKSGSFSVFKANGKYYWKAIWSNNFEDREGEILSAKAHDRYLARLEMKLTPLPELWYWHIKGTKHGQALWVARHDHLMLAVGDFDETPEAHAFVQHYRKSAEKVSHGFRYPQWAKKDGVYEDYNTFEISPLPSQAAANPYTSFEEIIDMAITEAQRARLEKILGKDKAEAILSNADKMNKALDSIGLAYKDFADVTPEKKEANGEGENLMAAAFLKMIEAQADIMERQDKLDAANKTLTDEQTALKAANEKLVAENADLRERMKMTPRASQAEATKTDDEKLQETMVERVSEYSEIWRKAGLLVPKEKPNNG